MTTKTKRTILGIIGILGIFGVCFDSLGIALVGLIVALLSFAGAAVLDPDQGFEYDSNGNVIE